MPTQYEIAAASAVMHDATESLTTDECWSIARLALAAAEAVRAKARTDGHRPAPGQRQTFVAMNGARGTMTWDSAIGWIVDDSTSYANELMPADDPWRRGPAVRYEVGDSTDHTATSKPQPADTQPPRKDYHTSAVPGDGLEMQPWQRTRAQSS